MPQSKASTNITEELIKALQDDTVRAIFGNIFDERMKMLAETVDFLKKENERNCNKINELTSELSAAKLKINELENYNRRDNLVINGLPLLSAAEAASTPGAERQPTDEHATSTEKAVLALCQQQLGLSISGSDISICHRLKKTTTARGPPPVIVRFTNRKARDSIYASRRQLRNCEHPTFINEDLSKPTAELFNHARKLVKAKKIYKTWTSGGSVYVRLSDLPSCKPKLVKSTSVLPNI